MAEEFELSDLCQSWVHSHEEDRAPERAYRTANYGFPASRGRESFELKVDGKLIRSASGPTDRPETTQGSWSLQGTRLRLVGETGTREFTIVDLSPDRLILKLVKGG